MSKTFEEITGLNEAKIIELCKIGIVRKAALKRIQMYDDYLKNCQKYKSMQAASYTADKFNVSENYVLKTVLRIRNNNKHI